MKILALPLTAVFMLLASSAQAEVIVGLGQNLVLEEPNSGTGYELRAPLALQAGYGFRYADLYMEYATFSESQGNTTVSVERQQSEISVWARHLFRRDLAFRPYAAAGTGFQSARVITRFNGETRRQYGRWEPLFAIAGGLQAAVWKGLEAGIEGRLTGSSGYAPNPAASMGIRLAWRY